MNTYLKILLLSFLFSASFCDSFGQQLDKKNRALRFLVRGGFDFGGDKVSEINFEDESKQSITTGNGGWIAAGAEYQVPALKSLLFYATVGYKYSTTKATNAHIRFTRVPIQLSANYMVTNKLRLGAGITSHQAVRFRAGGYADDLTFSPALGPTVELAYGPLGVTYTSMTYTDHTSERSSANSVGVSLTLAFPKR